MTTEEQIARLQRLVQQATSAIALLRSSATRPICSSCRPDYATLNNRFIVGDFSVTDHRTPEALQPPSRSDSGKSTATNGSIHPHSS